MSMRPECAAAHRLTQAHEGHRYSEHRFLKLSTNLGHAQDTSKYSVSLVCKIVTIPGKPSLYVNHAETSMVKRGEVLGGGTMNFLFT